MRNCLECKGLKYDDKYGAYCNLGGAPAYYLREDWEEKAGSCPDFKPSLWYRVKEWIKAEITIAEVVLAITLLLLACAVYLIYFKF